MGNWRREKGIDDVIGRMRDMGYKRGMTSNPDVYGRVFGYQSGLKDALDNGDRGREEVLKWRGVITLLALKDYFDLDLVIEKVEIPKTGMMKIAFSYALALTPQTVMFKDDRNKEWDWNWEQFYVIKLRYQSNDYVDIALFSPMTIIYPVVDLERKMPVIPQVTWFNRIDGKGEFKDPSYYLQKEEKMVVVYWLTNIENNLKMLSESKATDKVMLALVQSLIENYKRDLDVQGNNSCWFSIMDFFDNADIWNFQDLHQIGVKDFIGNTVELNIHIGNEKINLHDIFAEEICCFKWKKEAEEIMGRVKPFKNTRFADKYRILLNREKGGENTGLTDDGEEYYAFIPFGNKFVDLLLRNSNVISDVMKVFSMQLSKDKRNVMVKINFSEIDNEGVDLLHVYPLNFSQEISTALWPGKPHKMWKKYFIYFDNNASGMQICLPENVTGNHENRHRYWIYQCDCYPEAIGVCDRNERYVGAFFLQKADDSQVVSKSAEVCVDFGTSGTITYAKIDGETEYEITFAGEGSIPLLLKNEEGALQEIAQNFIPVMIGERKMYSIYKKFEQIARPEPTPILDGIIYLAGSMEMIPKEDGESKYLTNLKWMTDSNRGWFRAFMEQLCMQITWHLLCRGVNSIHWKYALPLSLDNSAQRRVENVWNEDIKKYLEDMSAVDISVSKFVTESHAVSRFFYSHKSVIDSEILNEECGYLAVDIGGGSVDFALWKGKNTMWEASADSAGRDIFSRQVFRYIQELKNVLDIKKDEDLIHKIDAIKSMEKVQGDSVAMAFFERLIGENNIKFQLAISDKGSDANRDWVGSLRSKIALGAAMILFSAGQILGEAIQLNKFSVVQEGTFYIVLAGNGSNLFDWIFSESWNVIHRDQHDSFVRMFLEGAKSRMMPDNLVYGRLKKMDIRIVKSPHPKKEVALGLLCSGKAEDDIIEELEHSFDASDIIGWKDAFLEAFGRNFANNQYSSYLFGNNAAMQKLQQDESWMNLARRKIGEEKEACSIMMSVILDWLYKQIVRSREVV